MNGVDLWLETGINELKSDKEGTDELGRIDRRILLSDELLKAAMEVLLMRAQYFRDNIHHSMEEDLQMPFLV